MEILRHLDDYSLSLTGSVATLGNFDGLHLGHQALVGSAVEDARQLGAQSVVLTFEPHPLKVLAPARAPKLLLSHKDKMEMLQSFGVDVVVIQKFDAAFARLPARDFVTVVLVERVKIKKVWVGRDLRFGQGRLGSVDDLLSWSSEGGFDVGIVEPVLVGGARVSSSLVRRLVEEGRVDDSIGTNPTFGDGPRTVESFLLDFNGDLYGEPVKLYFVKRIRAEKKFVSVDDLMAQMRLDVARARGIFDECGLRAGIGT
jgi:riboflavin kinase/FMN adenylyltransferase